MSRSIAAALRVPALLCALLLLILPGPAIAHEGHDHGAEAAPVPAAALPRAESVSERFELVVVVQGTDLVLYVDALATNAPVAEATVAVMTPEGRRKAVAAAPGTYRLAAPWLASEPHHDLVVGVSSEGRTDVLNLDLDLPAPAGPPAAGIPAAFGPKASDLKMSDPKASGPTAAAMALAGRLAGQHPAALAAGGFLAWLGISLGLGVFALARRRRSGQILAVLVAVLFAVLFAALLAGAAALVLVPVGTALAHEGHAEGPETDTPVTPAMLSGGVLMERARRLPDGSVFVPKSLQRLLALRTGLTAERSVTRSAELPGRIIPDPNASGVAQSSVGGRLAPPESGFPRLGTRVKRGDVLATVTPPVQAVDVSDMRQRQGELDQQIAILERRVTRFERLSTTGAVAQTQLDDARSELGGLRDRRAALDAVRREPEALVAPVDGIIAETNAVAGAMAAPGTVVYRIVDPARLWVEALSFEALAEGSRATARLGDGGTLQLAYRGTGLADRNQAVPVQFAVEGDGKGDIKSLRLGQFVTVLAPVGSARPGLPVARSGIVRAEGGSLVYEHVSAERFLGRPVRVAPLDADRMLVEDGITAGRRVVVQGAELLDQIR
ncbi:HlyD family efflux transporter periplasmic adaptor subunit [Methylobacterium sp. Leaf117]|uniref:HlyD family efflux transporter periplasmic adaptor subunit n=1 Tax=Methylobacterium sp. Leaf117 TaxID=1736260 RepID=UPI0006FB41B8|nr:HlyD family efflux transporter periplasmic adaptor subunit [Methylobacterium sp. Leaf117]KQP80567.1 RND transporter [Methylobacterium sp. Leaf117]